MLPITGRIKQRLRNGGAVVELVLSNTVTADSGVYQCVGENPAGYASASARLLVRSLFGFSFFFGFFFFFFGIGVCQFFWRSLPFR